jgi:limonene-1,2-epoxide hydrolase
MDQSPEEVVRAYLAAFGKSVAEDHAAYRKFLAKDVAYYSGTTMVHGSENTVTFSRRGEELLGLASWRAEVLTLIAVGEVVAVERVDIQISSTGEDVMRTPIMGYFKVRDGQITEWRDYWDPRPLIEYGEKYRARKGVVAMGWGDVPGGAESAAVAARG